MTMTKKLFALASVLALTGCVGGPPPEESEDYGPGHNVGEDCLTCHVEGGEADDAWTIGGTVFSDVQGTEAVESVSVLVYDTLGTLKMTLITDYNGNFWEEDSTPPSTYMITLVKGADTVSMPSAQTYTGCGAGTCHPEGSYVHIP
jgi:hypothetical protein